ncbi:MAG: sortase, partial [bacterium]|nr:sortase [bacterium]
GAILPVAHAQSGSPYTFTRDLTVGSTGDDVKALQQFLNSHGTQVAATGFGSSGNETTYFGKATRVALIRWQKANGVSPAAGYFGSKSRLVVVAPVVSEEQVSLGLPTRLKIPSIRVDAGFQYVGLASDGAMDAPKGPADVGWFNLGPRPGENGSAVIAGHYGRWKTGEGSVFDDLNKLSQGDKLYVEDEKGAVVTFVVRESRKYDPNADASDVFGSNDGKSHLNLVTCEGVWDKVSKTYSNRLVVFTDREME